MRVCMWESQWLREFILEAEGLWWSCRVPVPVFKKNNSPLSLSLSLFACLAQTTLLRRLQCISKGIWQVAYHYLTEFTQISQYHADAYHLTCWCTLFQPVSSISRLLCSQGRVRTRLVPNYVRTMFVLTFWFGELYLMMMLYVKFDVLVDVLSWPLVRFEAWI